MNDFYEEKLSDAEQNMCDFEARIEELEEELAKRSDIILELQSENKVLDKINIAKDTAISELEEKIIDFETEACDFEDQVEDLQGQIDDFETQVTELNEYCKSLYNKITTNKKTIKHLNKELGDV